MNTEIQQFMFITREKREIIFDKLESFETKHKIRVKTMTNSFGCDLWNVEIDYTTLPKNLANELYDLINYK